MAYRIGVDIGGSFTDFAIFNEETGALNALKVFSRPDAPGEEVLEGLRQLSSRMGIQPADVGYFTHGTTVGINTVIQRKGVKLALFTTSGFRDVLEIARLKAPDMYDLFSKRPAPLITRDRVFAIDERIDAQGNVTKAVDRQSVEAAVASAREAGCEGIVVSTLHSYKNPVNEVEIRDLCQAVAPDIPVFLSHEVWPIIREYERTITATVSGYVQPRVSYYLTSLQQALKNAGVTPSPLITKSNGGVMSAEQGKSECIQMILSGTACGVIGAAYVAKCSNVDKALSLDIGGTSADVAVILDGEVQYSSGELIGEFPIYIPSVSVSSIGDGGGSIARIDDLGLLKVGPESAGSTPGPVCFGRGGTEPTVTDSFVASGLVGFSQLGYGAVSADIAAARAAVGRLADKLGSSVENTAEAIQNICVSGMYNGVSGLVSRFGIDPREFTMIAFGGAGPMLAVMLARELNMAEVLVPPTPGALSALGGLVADLKNDFVKTIYQDLDEHLMPVLKGSFAELRERGMRWLQEEQQFDGPGKVTLMADMRYAGQSFEIETTLDQAWIDAAGMSDVADAFHARHEQLFGHSDRGAKIQVISIRLTVGGETPTPSLPKATANAAPCQPTAVIDAWMDGEMRQVPIYRRAELGLNDEFSGPAVVTQDDCTTVVLPDWIVRVDELGNLRISAKKKESLQ